MDYNKNNNDRSNRYQNNVDYGRSDKFNDNPNSRNYNNNNFRNNKDYRNNICGKNI